MESVTGDRWKERAELYFSQAEDDLSTEQAAATRTQLQTILYALVLALADLIELQETIGR